MEQVMQFLNELAENNTREWFNDNRKRYEESRDKVIFLTEVLINEIGKFDSAVRGLNPKDSVFRIFRDVRFSKDKRPYKTNFGSFICNGGRKAARPGYYFHIEPGNSFVGGGIYMPPADTLRKIRIYMAEHAEGFLSIMKDKHFSKNFPELYNDKLKTVPKGFPKDHEFIDLLRYKSFIFSKGIEDEVLVGDKYMHTMLNYFSELSPVNAFLYEALSE